MKITPYEKNAKKHPKKQIEQVANSIKEFGMNQPIVVDKQGVIVVGHGRYEACKSLGWSEEEILKYVKVVDLTEEQAKAYRLADNKLNESDWDMNLVVEELKGLSNEMLEITGFDKDLIIEPDEKDDEVPETPEEPQSKIGDLYELGNHRVLCGDSTKIEDVERLMDGKKCAVTFTSPPYNAGKSETLSGNTHTTDNKYGEYNDNKTQEEWKQLVLDTLKLAMTISEYQIYNIQMLAGNKKQLLLMLAEYVDHIADIAVWNKGHSAPAMAKNVMNSSYEWIIFFSSKENATRAINTGDFRGQMKNIFDIPPQRKNEFASVHAATMPVALPLEVLKYVTKRDDAVYDNFAGTGTTLIAAEKTGRICYGMELDPKYIDVIVERYVDYTGNNKIKKNGQEVIWQKK